MKLPNDVMIIGKPQLFASKKRKFFEKQFTAKVNTRRRDKAITEKKGFTNLVRRDLKMCFV